MEFKIKTLTPIWTGNINRECETLRETSLIGSLRWWFEAIVRGFGGYACDPTSENGRCKYEGSDASICPVCQLFGCTGWSRRFRLEISNNNTEKIRKGIIVKVREDENHKGWFLGNDSSGGVLGEFSTKICGDFREYEDLIGLLLHISALWGFGAKTQDGFGICEFNGDYDFDKAISQIKTLKYNNSKDDNLILPNLEDFFFAEIIIEGDIEENIKNALEGKLYVKKRKNVPINIEKFLSYIPEEYKGKFYPTAPLIRDWLRGLFRTKEFSDDLRHFLLGFVSIKGDPTPLCKEHLVHTVKENGKYKCEKCRKELNKNEYFEKMGSRIFVSHIYKFDNTWRFKIWGYIPKKLPNNEDNGVDRDKVLEFLYEKINEDKEFVDTLEIDGLDKAKIKVNWYEISERGECDNIEELLKKLVYGE
jgi:CRISPR-associated protein Cmr1